ncbi:hypothetical protein MHY29_02610 [Micrococcus sp. ACRRV]|uniref:hypothetical protein n=1 Tax=Micrococcus sp. ACRRV TaxID=2918203 RepID=UPI001EF1EEE9|nr:hypothetical protein [Micrococcus sp. ACRRV]MCG7421741.1 hypothetical protein [Micrococcus sp. ACRRV]
MWNLQQQRQLFSAQSEFTMDRASLDDARAVARARLARWVEDLMTPQCDRVGRPAVPRLVLTSEDFDWTPHQLTSGLAFCIADYVLGDEDEGDPSEVWAVALAETYAVFEEEDIDEARREIVAQLERGSHEFASKVYVEASVSHFSKRNHGLTGGDVHELVRLRDLDLPPAAWRHVGVFLLNMLGARARHGVEVSVEHPVTYLPYELVPACSPSQEELLMSRRVPKEVLAYSAPLSWLRELAKDKLAQWCLSASDRQDAPEVYFNLHRFPYAMELDDVAPDFCGGVMRVHPEGERPDDWWRQQEVTACAWFGIAVDLSDCLTRGELLQAIDSEAEDDDGASILERIRAEICVTRYSSTGGSSRDTSVIHLDAADLIDMDGLDIHGISHNLENALMSRMAQLEY